MTIHCVDEIFILWYILGWLQNSYGKLAWKLIPKSSPKCCITFCSWLLSYWGADVLLLSVDDFQLYLLLLHWANNWNLFVYNLQPGPRDSLLQCYIKRSRSNQTYYLFLGLNQGELLNICPVWLRWSSFALPGINMLSWVQVLMVRGWYSFNFGFVCVIGLVTSY